MDWQKLLESITVSVDQELRLRNEYLATENRILRQQINGRVRLSDGERKALAEIGQKLGKKTLKELATIAKPDTILAWHHKLVEQKGESSQPRKSVGRPRTEKATEDLVVRMAQENPSWGYDRIVGALANLDYQISDQTVGNILKRHGIPPAPQRQKTMTWREFIRIHRDVLGATAFFSSEIWTWFGFVIAYVLSCIRFDRHKVYAVSIASSLHERWTLLLLPWSLDLNAHIGHWVGLVQEEARPRPILFAADVQRYRPSAFTPRAYREPRPQGKGKGVVMPVGYSHPIRDGPRQGRHRLGRSLLDDTREAA
jgi:hypothetical protein